MVSPWTIVSSGEIRPVGGEILASIDSITNLRDGSRHALSRLRAFYFEANDSCNWVADAPSSAASPRYPEVWSSSWLEFDTEVSEATRSRFWELESTCVNRFPEDRRCYRSRLLATSDLDGDQRTEYWYSRPEGGGRNAWVVGEEDESGTEIVVLVTQCPYFAC